MSEKERKEIVIVGAGVIGLSIALQLKAQGEYQVTIIARDLPSDVDSRDFSSPWAGANWCSTTTSKEQQARDELTFRQWQRWTKRLPSNVLAEMPFVEYFYPQGHSDKVDQWRSQFLPEYRARRSAEGEETVIVEHTGLTMDAPAFLALLQEELLSRNSTDLFPRIGSNEDQHQNSNGSTSTSQQPVTFIRASLQRLSDAFEHVPRTSLIINASGLGSATLQDVLDKTVYPVLGQTVLIQASQSMQRAPYCAMKVPKNPNFSARRTSSEDHEFSYVIPRAKSGTIICGGCAIPDKYDTKVDEQLAERILQRCVEMVPQLLYDGVDSSSKDAWKTLTVIKRGLGLRPAREDGMRIELEQLVAPDNRPFFVLHAYGAGGGGFQSGYGVTVESVEKVIAFFSDRST